MVELLLVDARDLAAPSVHEVIEVARERAIPCGCVGIELNTASAVEHHGLADAFDFWLDGANGILPIGRALGLVVVDPARALLLTSDRESASTANEFGLQSASPDEPDITRRVG
jgi:hypothetical protein